MKKTLYTFLVWNFLLFVAGLSDIVFYRNLTSVEGMTISWTQPALVSITSFLILLSIYYGMHQLLFGKNFYSFSRSVLLIIKFYDRKAAAAGF